MVENLVKLDFKKNNIRDIQKALEDAKNILEEELLDMLVEDIEKYIKTLIDIINFIA